MSVWGKVVGGVAGFAVGGPLGAIIGAVAGHVYDKHKANEIPAGMENDARQIAFTTAVIVLAAKMAKADGHVSREEIAAFKQVFHIPPEEMSTVGRIFDEAKASADGYEPYAEQIALMFRGEPQVLEELIGALFHIAKSDGVMHPNELQFLRRVSLLFGFSEAGFERLRTIHLAGWSGQGGQAARAGDDYEILGVAADASDQDVKSAYRKLVRENHPDVLMAKGMPQEFIDIANDKLAAINDAYDRIKKSRGFK